MRYHKSTATVIVDPINITGNNLIASKTNIIQKEGQGYAVKYKINNNIIISIA